MNVKYPNFRHTFITYIDENKTYSDPLDWDSENRTSIYNFTDAYYMGPLEKPEFIEEKV
jgi:hypothetical protein